MKNLLLILYIAVMICSCSNSSTEDSPELEEFVAAFDDKSIEEIKEEVNENVKQFESITKFFENSFSNDIEKIAEEDERYGTEFAIDTLGIGAALLQFKNVVFNQEFEDYESSLSFEFQNSEKRKPSELGQGVSQVFVPQKIYYHDKEVKTDSIHDYEVDFVFSDSWGKAKMIDSIDIKFTVDYVKDYDVIELSLDKPVAKYEGGEIKLIKAQDNYVYITLSDTINKITEVQVLNKDGKVLNRSGYSNNGIAPDESKGVFTEMLGYLKKIQDKLNDDDFKDTAAFQEYLKKNMNGLDFFNDTDGVFHKQSYYYGTVASVKLYFAKETGVQETIFRTYNATPAVSDDFLFEMNTEEGLVFLDNNGETKMSITGLDQEVAKIGGNFYEDNNYFYYLNRATKSLDTLLIYNISAYKNGIVGIQKEQEYDDHILYNSDNEVVSDKKYWNLKEAGTILFGSRNEKYYIINPEGEERLIPGVTDVDNVISDDRILVVNDSKNGFINSKGVMVLPTIYDDAKDFEQGLTAVKFDETYKLIDTEGKVLLDTGEDDINFFGKDSNGNRIYKFGYGGKSYNHKGELIKD